LRLAAVGNGNDSRFEIEAAPEARRTRFSLTDDGEIIGVYSRCAKTHAAIRSPEIESQYRHLMPDLDACASGRFIELTFNIAFAFFPLRFSASSSTRFEN